MVDNRRRDVRPRRYSPSGAKTLCIIKGGSLAVVGSVALAVLAHINSRVLNDVPWFLFGVALLSVMAVRLPKFKDPTLQVQLYGWRVVVVSLVLATALGIAAILLSPLSVVLAGTAGLPGDRVNGSEFFRGCVSAGTLAGAAVIEEAGIRGQTQFGLYQYVRPIAAEFVANAVFVLLHVIRLGNPGEALFVCLLAIAGGRMAAVTQSIRWPIAVHLGANLVVTSAVLYNRV